MGKEKKRDRGRGKKEKESGVGLSGLSKKRNNSGAVKGGAKNGDNNDVEAHADGDLDSDDELHGVVEDIEISRTRVGERKNQDKQNHKEKSTKKKRKIDVDSKTEMETDGKALENVNEEMPKDENDMKAEKAKSEGEKEEDEPKAVTESAIEKVPKGYWGELKAQPVDIVNGEVVKRKKKKTRSKQKNILKDTRSDDKKPSYRPLSIETLTKQSKRKK